MTSVLQIENVSKTYDGKIHALKDINMNVNSGELVAIIGPSGAGKSTLLRVINRMIDVTDGSIVFDNQEVTTADKNVLKNIRKNIGMVFQHYNLVYRSSVLENVLHGRLANYSFFDTFFKRYTKQDVDSAMNILKMLGMDDRAYDRAAKLSGGQKQRVGIARALIQDPKMILCDAILISLKYTSIRSLLTLIST